MYFSLIVTAIVTLVGVCYTIATFLLPAAKIGNPVAPKVFPMILSVSLLVIGISLLVSEIQKLPRDKEGKANAMAEFRNQFGKAEFSIVLTALNSIVYALLFNRIGYVFSTIIFLEAQLMVFRGWKTWRNSLLIAVVFAVVVYLLFDYGLGIFLPASFLGFI